MKLDSLTGLISGTPEDEGSFKFTVQAESEGKFAYQDFTIDVLWAPPTSVPPSFEPPELDKLEPALVEVGTAYV